MFKATLLRSMVAELRTDLWKEPAERYTPAGGLKESSRGLSFNSDSCAFKRHLNGALIMSVRWRLWPCVPALVRGVGAVWNCCKARRRHKNLPTTACTLLLRYKKKNVSTPVNSPLTRPEAC